MTIHLLFKFEYSNGIFPVWVLKKRLSDCGVPNPKLYAVSLTDLLATSSLLALLMINC